MPRKRRSGYATRTEACKPIAAALIEFGYPDVTAAMVKTVLDAWLAGKRGGELPHGVIGLWAERTFNEIEDVGAGRLALLEDA